jgi:hypothetical protein
VQDYLIWLVNQHNAQSLHQFAVRTVQVTDPNDFIIRANINYPTTWEEMKKKLPDMLGGNLHVEYDGGSDTYMLDYLTGAAHLSTQEITFGENLLAFREEADGSGIATGIIAIGARPEGASQDEPRITMATENNGVDYVSDPDAVAKYGLILRTDVYDDVHSPLLLRTYAENALPLAVAGVSSYDFTAVDLHLVDSDIRAFRFLDQVTVNDMAHGIHAGMVVTKLVTDMDNPDNSRLSVGVSSMGLGEYLAGQTRDMVGEAVTDVTNYTKSRTDQIFEQINQVYSLIEQTASSIIMQVSSLYATKTDVQAYISQSMTQLEQNSNSFNFNFEQIMQMINDQNGQQMEDWNTLRAYVRIVNGDIILGKEDSPSQLRITNDSLQITYNGEVMLNAYNNRMSMTSLFLLESMAVGNWRIREDAATQDWLLEWVGTQ